MFITDQEKEDLMKKRREFNRFFRSISLASALLAGCISMPNKQEIKSKEPDYLGMSYKKAIEEVKTPEEAAKYVRQLVKRAIDSDSLDNGFNYSSFKRSHEGYKIDCSEAAASAAALLQDDGFKPLVLFMLGKEGQGHCVYVYEKKNKLGIIGINNEDNNYGFKDTDEIVNYYNKIFEGKGADKIEHHFFVDLKERYGDDYMHYENDYQLKKMLDDMEKPGKK